MTDRWGDLAKLLDVNLFANKRLYVPAFRATPGATINATGAGDAFIGGVLAGFNLSAARSRGLATIIRIGHAAALQRVEIGRQALTAPQVLKEMEAGKLEIMQPPNAHLRIAANATVEATPLLTQNTRVARGRSPRRSRK